MQITTYATYIIQRYFDEQTQGVEKLKLLGDNFKEFAISFYETCSGSDGAYDPVLAYRCEWWILWQ